MFGYLFCISWADNVCGVLAKDKKSKKHAHTSRSVSYLTLAPTSLGPFAFDREKWRHFFYYSPLLAHHNIWQSGRLVAFIYWFPFLVNAHWCLWDLSTRCVMCVRLETLFISFDPNHIVAPPPPLLVHLTTLLSDWGTPLQGLCSVRFYSVIGFIKQSD